MGGQGARPEEDEEALIDQRLPPFVHQGLLDLLFPPIPGPLPPVFPQGQSASDLRLERRMQEAQDKLKLKNNEQSSVKTEIEPMVHDTKAKFEKQSTMKGFLDAVEKASTKCENTIEPDDEICKHVCGQLNNFTDTLSRFVLSKLEVEKTVPMKIYDAGKQKVTEPEGNVAEKIADAEEPVKSQEPGKQKVTEPERTVAEKIADAEEPVKTQEPGKQKVTLSELENTDC